MVLWCWVVIHTAVPLDLVGTSTTDSANSADTAADTEDIRAATGIVEGRLANCKQQYQTQASCTEVYSANLTPKDSAVQAKKAPECKAAHCLHS